jgi:hypothetical protein
MGQLMKRDGIDCATNVFAPTVGASAVRLFFALAAQANTSIFSVDVATAYLTAECSGRFYTHFPTVFRFAQLSTEELNALHAEAKSANGQRLNDLRSRWRTKFNSADPQCLAILKSVYGDPAAGMMFWKHWRSILLHIGLKQSRIEPCFFYKTFGDDDEDPLAQHQRNAKKPRRTDEPTPKTKRYVFVISFVDDAAIQGDDVSKEWFITKVGEYLPITIERPISSFLGMQVTVNLQQRYVELTASGMINSAMERFRTWTSKCTPQSLPAKPGATVTPATPEEFETAKHLPFQSVLGVLCWLANWVKIEALCIVSMLGRCNSSWSVEHFDIAIKVLVYCHTTKNRGIRWTQSDNDYHANLIYGYCDASFAMDATRRSRTGKTIFCNQGPIIVQSALQKTISLSTMAAETIALSSTALDICGLRTLMGEIGHWQPHPTIVMEDNTATIAFAHAQSTLSQRSKHLQIRELKIREMIEDGVIDVIYCRTTAMVADLMTKNLNGSAFPRFAAFICGYASHTEVIVAILKDTRE